MRGDAERFLAWVRDGAVGLPPRVLIVAAHPDDETVGAGALLPRFPHPALLYLTDGAPHDRQWWGSQSFGARDGYARARRAELECALAVADVPPAAVRSLELVDQEASADLELLTLRVAAHLQELRPEVVLTHPYEGGHPDHDGAAFAVRAAHDLIARDGEGAPGIVEFSSYSVVGFGLFLPHAGAGEEVVHPLSEEERDRKERMLACFATQEATLRSFPRDRERFRAAPRYDFTAPPHAGMLNYERFGWGGTGTEWRERAAQALRGLGLVPEGAAP